jgi:hypothetical protein
MHGRVQIRTSQFWNRPCGEREPTCWQRICILFVWFGTVARPHFQIASVDLSLQILVAKARALGQRSGLIDPFTVNSPPQYPQLALVPASQLIPAEQIVYSYCTVLLAVLLYSCHIFNLFYVRNVAVGIVTGARAWRPRKHISISGNGKTSLFWTGSGSR